MRHALQTVQQPVALQAIPPAHATAVIRSTAEAITAYTAGAPAIADRPASDLTATASHALAIIRAAAKAITAATVYSAAVITSTPVAVASAIALTHAAAKFPALTVLQGAFRIAGHTAQLHLLHERLNCRRLRPRHARRRICTCRNKDNCQERENSDHFFALPLTRAFDFLSSTGEKTIQAFFSVSIKLIGAVFLLFAVAPINPSPACRSPQAIKEIPRF